MKEKQRILVVDDDENIAELIGLYLNKECFETKLVYDGEQALKAVKDFAPNLVLELGADDYIMKPFDSKEMVARVKAVLRRSTKATVGESTPTPTPQVPQQELEIVTFPDLQINLSDYSVHYKDQMIEMPPKELELFYFLASHPNQVFTREQLLDHIWSYDYIGDTRTVDVHIKRLREKFKDHDQWKLATVWGIGYKFEFHEKGNA